MTRISVAQMSCAVLLFAVLAAQSMMCFPLLCREMGCVVKSSKGSATSKVSIDLSVVLLPPAAAVQLQPKKLVDYFLIIKAGSKRGRN